MDGVIVTPLKQITHPKGDVLHGLKKSDEGFSSFGEAYFSTIKSGQIKGWKMHKEMVMNLIVPLGCVKFVLHDTRENSHTSTSFQEVILGRENYQRLTVPNGVWVAFQGLDDTDNLLLNIASIEHDPAESVAVDINNIKYDW
jgi:dTDP-4-dehydrorhamnose 3,5-epimerase